MLKEWMNYYVYILASKMNGTLYIGRTENLAKRIMDHKSGAVQGFTCKYGVKTLVHVEIYEDALAAAEREKRLKAWRREWKINLIESANPTWRDLTETINM